MPVISLISYNRSPNFEECYRGFMDELPKLGMVDGTNCRVVLRDAQLDIGTLNTIVTATAEERVNLFGQEQHSPLKVVRLDCLLFHFLSP